MRRKLGGLGFNPRTRVGCDLNIAGVLLYTGPVSIHAPAWGATSSGLDSIMIMQDCFNPRTRVGCDHRLRGRVSTQ